MVIEETKRQSYLNAMGVTQWQLRSVESNPQSNQAVVEVKKQVDIKGLRWLNKGSINGLLVVFSKQRNSLTPDSRLLLSKMLKSIHFLPVETGFAILAEDDNSSAEAFSLETVKAILALGNETNHQLLQLESVSCVPDTKLLILDGRKIVTTWHPDELLENSDNKAQTWDDLKQLVQLFNNT